MCESTSTSDAEQEIFLFNESSFANLFESSKFNSINASIDNTFMNLLSHSERSLRLFGNDEDFYTELESLKNMEFSSYDLDDADIPESSVVSSPRFNSLMNSVTSMDHDTNEEPSKEETDLEYNNFYEDEKLINESIIASCTLTKTMLNTSSSNVSELSSAESSTQKNSTPIQRLNPKGRIISLRKKILTKPSNNSLILQESLNSPSIKPKRYMQKSERNRIAYKYYRRNKLHENNIVNIPKFNETTMNRMSKNLNLVSYKQSSKVEKLLNDSRGMRKYLIDYDGLMLHQKKKQLTNLTYASLLNITSNNTTQIVNHSSRSSSPKLNISSLKSASCPSRLVHGFNSSVSRSLYRSKNLKTTSDRTMSGNTLTESTNFAIVSSQCSSNRCSSGYLTEC